MISKYIDNKTDSELYNNRNQESMTENQNGKVDPVAIRELISQGIPMKRKESEIKRSQSEEQFVESERPNIKGFFKSPKKRKAKVRQGGL